jgi:arabinofuranosyltransferase
MSAVTNPPLPWTRSIAAPSRLPLARVATYIALAALMYSLVLCAWQCDDAYITFRTVRNFWAGWGLTWNPDERVQAYTHPLWMFLSLAVYGVTREVFFSMTLVAIALTMATAIVLRHVSASSFQFATSVVVLIGSCAFIDFSVSGLENPLLSLLLVASVVASLTSPSHRSEWLRALCLSGVFLTRQDAMLLVGPLWLALSLQRRILWRSSILGLLPIAAWELFSLVYYGVWVPNTALAKLNVAIPPSRLLLEGFAYLHDSLLNDPITILMIAGAVLTAAVRGGRLPRLLALGAVLYVLYVVRIGGDFMSGRFLGAPLIIAVCAANLIPVKSTPASNLHWAWTSLAVLSVSYAVLWPSSPLRSTVDYGRDYEFTPLANERAVYYRGTGLLPVLVRYPELTAQKLPVPWTSTAEEGRDFVRSKQQITVRTDVGIVGFLAGRKIVIDTPGLADPLLARIRFVPAPKGFRIGHYVRPVPDGYLATRALGHNLIERADLHEAYDAIDLVVRGPLFTAARWRAIWQLQTGHFDAAFKN